MKRNKNFALREIADKVIVVPFGSDALDFNGIITLNDSARFLWEKFDGEFSVEDLIGALTDEYGIDSETAGKAADAYVTQMKDVGCIE